MDVCRLTNKHVVCYVTNMYIQPQKGWAVEQHMASTVALYSICPATLTVAAITLTFLHVIRPGVSNSITEEGILRNYKLMCRPDKEGYS